MRTLEETDELTSSDTEITLGTRSVLGIFFGLALICGVFFGFGYSLGRGNTSKAVAPAPIAAPSPESDADTPPPVKTVVEQPAVSDADTPAAKPSGAIAEPAPAATASAAQTPAATTVSETLPAPKSIATAPAAAANAPQASSEPTGAIMVQIAAVSRPQDAEVLVSALGKLGYHASALPSPTDNLLHVQIGPFATRDEARAMRTKLLNDGYNAILK